MALSNDLISQFVKATRDKEETSNESTAYGKIVIHDGKEYVQLDGSELLTPISSTTVVKDGDRVIVTIKDHSAIVTGDFTNPSANNKDVVEIGNKISEFEIVIADKVTTKQLEAEIARIEQLRAKDLEATNAKIETLEAKTAKIDKIEADQVEVNGKIQANEAEITTLRADIADFKDVTTNSVKAIEGKFNTLEADYTSFEQTTTNKLNAYEAQIGDLEADMLTAEKADLKYANIDFSNIKEAAIEKLFTDSGIIKDLIMSDGKVTGELVGVTIKGDLIEGNTLKADKLVILGEDGLYYKLNVDALGETTASADPKYQNGLDGSVIIAESITAEKIAVDDLVAFGATIGGFNINDHAIYSGAKAGIDSNNEGIFIGDDGQINIGDTNQYLKYFKDEEGNYKLEILADSLKFGANKTTIEEYIESKTENISTIKEAEGSDLYINDGQQIIEFRVDGKSEQEIRSGKNLLKMTPSTSSSNGLTPVINKDGSLSLSGTVSATWSTFSDYTEVDIPAGTYTLSNNKSVSYNILMKVTYDDNTSLSCYLPNGKKSATFEFPKKVVTIKMTLEILKSGETYNETLYLQLERGSTATEFEKYGASPSPEYPSEIESLGYENLFKPTLIADDGVTINVTNATVELEDDVFILTCKNGTDMYFGQVANTGIAYSGLRGNLIDVTGVESISYNISNELFTKNFVTYYDENLISLKPIAFSKSKDTINLKNAPEGTKYITFRFGITQATIGETYRTLVQITKSDKVLPYIPFGKYGIEIVNEGKNKIKPHIGSHTWSGVTGTYDSKTDTFSVKGTTTVAGGISFAITDSKFKLKKGVAYTQSIKTISGTQSMHVVPSVINSEGVVTYNYFHDNKTRIPDEDLTIHTYNVYINAEAGVTIDWTFKVQFEKGSVATEYEPYRSNSTLLELNEPLRGFQNGIKDVAYIKQGKLYVDRKIGSVTLKGGETIFGYSAVQGDYFLVQAKYTDALPVSYTEYMSSNYFPFKSNWGVDLSRESVTLGGSDGRSFQFKIASSRLESLDLAGFNKWLKEHPTELIYELYIPFTEEIGYVDLSMTKNSVNDYSVNDPMSPNLYCKYYKDGVLIDDTIAEEFKNINNNLINNYYTKTEVDTQFKVTTDSITASVSEIKTKQENTDSSIEALDKDILELSKTVSAKMTSEEVTIAIQNEIANGVSHVKTSTGFTFNEEGLTVSKTGKEMSTTIDEDGMTIKRNDEERLIANNEGVIAYDLHAKTYLIVGSNSRFEDYEKDNKKQTGCFWIGDTEV